MSKISGDANYLRHVLPKMLRTHPDSPCPTLPGARDVAGYIFHHVFSPAQKAAWRTLFLKYKTEYRKHRQLYHAFYDHRKAVNCAAIKRRKEAKKARVAAAVAVAAAIAHGHPPHSSSSSSDHGDDDHEQDQVITVTDDDNDDNASTSSSSSNHSSGGGSSSSSVHSSKRQHMDDEWMNKPIQQVLQEAKDAMAEKERLEEENAQLARKCARLDKKCRKRRRDDSEQPLSQLMAMAMKNYVDAEKKKKKHRRHHHHRR